MVINKWYRSITIFMGDFLLQEQTWKSINLCFARYVILLSSSNVLLITWWISCVHICAMSDDAITNRKIIAECQVSRATNNNIVSFRQRKAWTYSTFRVIEIKLQLISSSFYVISEMLTRRKLKRNSRSSHVSLFYSLR